MTSSACSNRLPGLPLDAGARRDVSSRTSLWLCGVCLALGCLVLLAPAAVFAAQKAVKAEQAKAADPAGGPGRPVGRVSMDIGQGGFILSATGGKGVLTFKGAKHVFKVGGMGVGGLGVSTIKATGEVYNLKRMEDFPGAYIQARAGYAAGDGKGLQWLENTNGVVLKLRFVSKGVSLNLGADGLKIEMGAINKGR